MINQGMIQGNSALVYKLYVDSKVTYSKYDDNNKGWNQEF